MSQPHFDTIKAYFLHIRSIAAKRGLTQAAFTIQVSQTAKRIPTISSKTFSFKDGAILEFYETLQIANGRIERLSYSFHYARPDGWYFRYDKDPDRAKPHIHPLNHLHVNGDDPRYPTHDTNFEEIIEFILAAFYP